MHVSVLETAKKLYLQSEMEVWKRCGKKTVSIEQKCSGGLYILFYLTVCSSKTFLYKQVAPGYLGMQF